MGTLEALKVVFTATIALTLVVVGISGICLIYTLRREEVEK